MITVYTWIPTPIGDALERKTLPDIGHASLAVIDADGRELGYASYWPELDSKLAELSRPWKPRTMRNPATYAQECDPGDGFMQRPAEFTDTIAGLDEAQLLDDWSKIADRMYDVAHWNCACAARYLLVRAMNPDDYTRLRESGSMSDDELAVLNGETPPDTALWERVRHFFLSRVACMLPEDIRTLARNVSSVQNALVAPAITEPEPART